MVNLRDNRGMKTRLTPRKTRIVPSRESRNFHFKRNAQYSPDKFETYNDWFYFIHVDPIVRGIHAFGMVFGFIFYFFSAYTIWIRGFGWDAIVQFLSGAFFFYFLPLISHYTYEGNAAKATPDKFLSTLIPVIHINLLTLTGTYDHWLRRFIQKYPFTMEAWDLEEKKLF